MATKNQRIAFFNLWSGAKREVRILVGAADDESARHAWIHRHTGYTDSINAVKPGADFGRLMLETALIADDYEAVSKWSVDEANRWSYLIGEQLRQLGGITGEAKPWAYACGIFAHLRLPASWEDIPEDRLAEVFKMLDTHRADSSGRRGGLGASRSEPERCMWQGQNTRASRMPGSSPAPSWVWRRCDLEPLRLHTQRNRPANIMQGDFLIPPMSHFLYKTPSFRMNLSHFNTA
jgi:hypothetical protein